MHDKLHTLCHNIDISRFIVTITPTAYSEYILEIRDRYHNGSLCYRKNTCEPQWWVDVEQQVKNYELSEEESQQHDYFGLFNLLDLEADLIRLDIPFDRNAHLTIIPKLGNVSRMALVQHLAELTWRKALDIKASDADFDESKLKMARAAELIENLAEHQEDIFLAE